MFNNGRVLGYNVLLGCVSIVNRIHGTQTLEEVALAESVLGHWMRIYINTPGHMSDLEGADKVVSDTSVVKTTPSFCSISLRMGLLLSSPYYRITTVRNLQVIIQASTAYSLTKG